MEVSAYTDSKIEISHTQRYRARVIGPNTRPKDKLAESNPQIRGRRM